ncbi:unnamed protein product [Symbiodinium sp. KB8]|nr:unnamed protein product [Symbiodinium sp. KB8]
MTNASTETSLVVNGLDLSPWEGRRLFATVRAYSREGTFSAVSSDGAIVVTVPPTPPAVLVVVEPPAMNSSEGGNTSVSALGGTSPVSADHTPFSRRGDVLAASWTDFQSPAGLAIASYRVAVCTAILALECADEANKNTTWYTTGNSTFAQLAPLSLAEGVAYVIAVEATDEAGLRTVAFTPHVTVDTTPPSVQSASVALAQPFNGFAGAPDSMPTDVLAVVARAAAESTDTAGLPLFSGLEGLHLTVDGLHDAESRIVSIAWCAGSEPGLCDFVEQVQVSDEQRVALLQGQAYEIPQGVAPPAQLLPRVAAAAAAREQLLDAVADSFIAEATLNATLEDSNSTLALNTTLGGSVLALNETAVNGTVLNGTAAATNSSAGFIPEDLASLAALGTPPPTRGGVVVTIFATSGAGDTSLLASQSYSLDLTNPTPGKVSTGFVALADQDGDAGLVLSDPSAVLPGNASGIDEEAAPSFLTSLSHIGHHWSDWSDVDSDIVVYVWGVASAARADTLMNEVRAASQAAAAQNLTTPLDVEWPILDVLPLRLVEEGSSAQDFTLSLPAGASFRGVVVGVSSVGRFSVAISEEVITDVSPPVFNETIADGNRGGILDGDGVLDNSTSLPVVEVDYILAEGGVFEAHWAPWYDHESGIVSYEWTVFEESPFDPVVSIEHPGSDAATWLNRVQMIPWVDVGESTTAFTEGLGFKPTHRYRAALRVTNGAGLVSEVVSDGVRIDEGEPCIGQVEVESTEYEDEVFVSSPDTIDASWTALLDSQHMNNSLIDCTQLVDANGATEDAQVAEQLQAISAAPISHFEWQLRIQVALSNGTTPPLPEDAVTETPNVTVTQNGAIIPTGTLAEPASVPLNDSVSLASSNNSDPFATVLPWTKTGPQYASAWSACCSSFNERIVPASTFDWNWRSTRPVAHFGRSVVTAGPRLVAVGGMGGFAVLSAFGPWSTSRWVPVPSAGDAGTGALAAHADASWSSVGVHSTAGDVGLAWPMNVTFAMTAEESVAVHAVSISVTGRARSSQRCQVTFPLTVVDFAADGSTLALLVETASGSSLATVNAATCHQCHTHDFHEH